jgi:hypothetical protein
MGITPAKAMVEPDLTNLIFNPKMVKLVKNTQIINIHSVIV